MKYPLPNRRPVTNFIWRYTPRFGAAPVLVLRILSAGCALVALYRFLPWLSGWVSEGVRYIPPISRVHSGWEYVVEHPFTWIFIAGALRVLAAFSARRNFVNPLLADGVSLVEANKTWEARERQKPFFLRVYR